MGDELEEPLLEEEENEEIPVVDPEDLNKDLPDEYIPKKKESEAEGGTGSVYKVTTTSWSAFKSAVMGHGYDIDNFYGWQCWDGAALLWQQFGKALLTGNGLAIGCWDLKRSTNKYDLFGLVSDVNALKKGDVIVMRPNHIGFFDGYDGGYMIIVGQNQGGTPGPNGGSSFNRIKITKSAFAGAFRLKKWQTPAVKVTEKQTWKGRRNYVLTEDTYISAIPSDKKAGSVLHKKGEVLDIGEYTEWSNGKRFYRTKRQIADKDQRGYGKSKLDRAETAKIKSVIFE